MSRLLLPDGNVLELPVDAASRAGDTGGGGTGGAREAPVLLASLGRGRHGVPASCTAVSRVAAEVLLPATDTGGGFNIMLRVLGRNSVFLARPDASTHDGVIHASSLRRLLPNTEHEWPVGATIFLLHSDNHLMQFPFVLQAGEPEAPAVANPAVDPDATQDVLPPAEIGAAADDGGAAAPAACASRAPSVAASLGGGGGPAAHIVIVPPTPSRQVSAPAPPSPVYDDMQPLPLPAEPESGAAPQLPETFATATSVAPDAAALPSSIAAPFVMPSLSLQMGSEAMQMGGEDDRMAPPSQSSAAVEAPNVSGSGSQASRKRRSAVLAAPSDASAAGALPSTAAPVAADAAPSDSTAATAALSSSSLAGSHVAAAQNVPAPATDTSMADVKPNIAAASSNVAAGDGDGGGGGETKPETKPDPDGAPLAKRPRHALFDLKRSLPDTLQETTPAAPPVPYLAGWAVHLVGEGVGARQVEILHQSIVKHGGVLLQELPRHSHYTHAADKARQKRREREAAAAAAQALKSPSAKAAAAAAAAAVAAAEPPKLDILILCSPSIRTKKELVDVLVRRARHQQAKLDVKLLHVPQRSSASSSASSAAGGASPPGSPRSHASTSPVASPARPTAAAGLSGSGADTGGKDKIRLRSNWRIAHLTYLVDCNRRQALLPFDRYALDDEDPAQLAAANKKLELLNASTAFTPAAGAIAPSAQVAAPAAANDKMSSAAAEADTSALAAAAVDDDEADDGGEDDGDGAYADPSKPRSAAEIVAWNTAIASQLEEVSQKYRAQSKEQWFRESAFRQAASVVRSLPFALTDARQVAGMKGIGSSILEEIRSILATGHSGRLEALKSDPKLQVLQLLQSVHGIGPAIAEKLYAQGVRTLDDLRARGSSLTAQQTLSLRYYDELSEKIPRAEVAEFEQRIRAVLKTIDPRLRMEVCGSYRRGKATCGDIDVLVSHPDPNYRYSDEHSRRDAAAASSSAHRGGGGGGHKSSFQYLLEELMRRLHVQGLLTDDLVHPSSKQRYKAHTVQNIYESGLENETYSGIGMIPRDEQRKLGGKHRRIDIKVYSTAEFPFALLYFTGSKDFNRLMRLYCNRHRSLSLSDKALTPYVSGGRAAKAGAPRTKLATGMPIPCASEEDIFRAVGLDYIPPTQRDAIPPIFLGK